MGLTLPDSAASRMLTQEHVRLERRQRGDHVVAEIRLDRPDKDNALSMAMIERLGSIVEDLARDRTVFRCAQQLPLTRVGPRRRLGRCHQAGAKFDAQHAADGLIQALLADRTAFDFFQRRFVQALPAIRCHEHIKTGIERRRTRGFRTARDVGVAIPVAHDKTIKTHPTH